MNHPRTGSAYQNARERRRAAGSDTLTRLQILSNGVDGVQGLTGAIGVLVSPDGAYVFSAGTAGNQNTHYLPPEALTAERPSPR